VAPCGGGADGGARTALRLAAAGNGGAQLQLLTEIVPQWISLVRLGDDEDLTVRLDEDVSFSEVQQAIKAARTSV
jgi:hypothetical protein